MKLLKKCEKCVFLINCFVIIKPIFRNLKSIITLMILVPSDHFMYYMTYLARNFFECTVPNPTRPGIEPLTPKPDALPHRLRGVALST